MRVYPDEFSDGLLVYGNLINNTGTLQELQAISGAFFDAQGEVISDEDNIYAYWPVNDILPGSSVPFEMLVEDIDTPADFKLDAKAEPDSDTPRQDFEFSEVEQWTENANYCVKGDLHNPGDELDEYLVIALVLYDAEDKVIKFTDYGEFDSGEGMAEDNSAFEICVDLPTQEVARYELRAWGL